MSITKQQRKNVETFLARWATIPNENVIHRLGDFQSLFSVIDKTPTCNTVACAGGWMALMPEFKAMGVEVGVAGEPKIGSKSTAYVAEKLFGVNDEWSLFGMRQDDETGTDHEVVRKRFEALL